MSQQPHPYPPQQNAGGGGGRGRGGGGYHGGRGGGGNPYHPNHYTSPPSGGGGGPQGTPPFYGAVAGGAVVVAPGSAGGPPSAGPAGQAGPGRIGAWQPAAPTSSLQAAAMQTPPNHHQHHQQSPYGQQPPHSGQQQQQRQHQHQPPPGGQPMPPGPGGYPGYYNPYAANPYAPWQAGGGGGAGGGGPPPPHMYPAHQYPGMRGGAGGVYYPPPPMAPGQSPGLMATPPPGAPSQQRPSSGGGGSGATTAAGGATPPGAGPFSPATNSVPATQLVQAPKPRRPLVITDKEGNVIDLTAAKKTPSAATPNSNHATPATTSLSAAAAASAKSTSPVPPGAAAASNAAASTPSAGDKLRQAALERLKKSSDASRQEEEAAAAKKKDEEGKAQREAEEEKARLLKAEEEAAAKKKAEEELAAKKRMEEEEKLKKEAEEKEAAAAKQAEEAKRNESQAAAASASSLASAVASTSISEAPRRSVAAGAAGGSRIVYSKDALLKFRTPELIRDRPASLPDMTIVRGPSRGKSGGERGGGGGGGSGGRQGSMGGGPNAPRRQSSTGDRPQRDGGGGGEWSRGQSQPKGQQGQGQGQQGQNRDRDRGRQRSGRGGMGGPMLYDGPVAPLIKSENHWKPRKNDSAQIVAEKQVKAILNKMTKEKFDRLSNQMLEIRINSHEILNMMIMNVFDKAIDEPSFGDMYADLCVKLSKSAQVADFVHVIESDEEPPTEDGAPVSGESSSYSVYRWSSSVGTTDSDVVGPFSSEEECYDAALEEEDAVAPVPRGEMELELVSVSIKRGIFVKILKKKNAEEGESNIYYVVYFPVSEAAECGQQLSEIFLSEVECRSDATKKNSFKRTLLEKCQDEFDKQDIYVDWKKEKAEYVAKKSTLTDAERAEREEELDFRRIRIKKQMLGNVKFIGQLYKKNLLKERIMRLCIAQLLKLKEIDSSPKYPEYKDEGDMDLDEEDHEAICSIFATIGATIDTTSAASFMNVCFTKIKAMSVDQSLPSRSRFMYKDLLDLRSNNWVPRRKEEKAKTLDEIRQDVEREERRQAQLSQQGSRGGPGGGSGGRGGGGGDFRQSRSGRGDARTNFNSSARPRQVRPQETDDDGFTTIASSRAFTPKATPTKILKPSKPVSGASSLQRFAALEDEHAATPVSPSEAAPVPLKRDQLERRIRSVRTDFMADGGNVSELLVAIDEILARNRDAGGTIVDESINTAFECKDGERDAIVRILPILFEKGKVSKANVEEGAGGAIEFIDDILPDAPRAYEHLSRILAELLRVNAITLDWVCTQLEKTKTENPQTKAPDQVLRHTLSCFKKSVDSGSLEKVVSSSKGELERLVGADNWMTIYKAI